jgi:hypothetical protein
LIFPLTGRHKPTRAGKSIHILRFDGSVEKSGYRLQAALWSSNAALRGSIFDRWHR